MTFTYTGDAGRYYSQLGITPELGESYDLAADPDDGRWTADAPKSPPRSTPEPPATAPVSASAATPTAPEEG